MGYTYTLLVIFGLYGKVLHGFLIDGLGATLPPSDCDITVFANCTDFQKNFVNYTNGVQIDTDAAYEFYCGPKGRETIQCLRDHADARCDANTDTGAILRVLAQAESQTTRDTMCQNKSSYTELMDCQKLLPNLQPFIDCVTGDTLNQTLDPKDTCRFFRMTLGCSYKYTDIMCPNQLQYFTQSAQTYGGCHLDLPTSPNALSCDKDMAKACEVAFNPPSISQSQEYFQFLCGGKGQQYINCIKKVNTLCKVVDTNFQLSQMPTNQTLAMCSDPTGFQAFQKCFLQYQMTPEFSDCLFTNDTSDICSLMKISYQCNSKFIMKTCPSLLSYYQRTQYFDNGKCQIGVRPDMTASSVRPEVTFFSFAIVAAIIIVDFV